MPKVSIMPYIKNQYFNNSGVPLAGGKLYTYFSGTSTNKTTYQNPSGTIAHTNPVILDSAGRVAVYLTSGAYKLVLKDADDVTIWTEDGVSISDLVSEVSIVSDLRSLTAGISTFVRTLGYYSINDKGGWTYYWDASSALDDDGGMVIRPNSLPALGRWIGAVPSDEILNVRVYGAVCDGTTDDVSEIQACDTYCNANGLTILIDSSIYVATDPVLLSTIKLLQSAQFKYGSFSPTLKVIIDDNDATQHFSCTSTYAPTLTNQTVYKCEWFGETLTNHPIMSACYNLSMNAKSTYHLNTNLIANTADSNYLFNGEYAGVKKVSLNVSAAETSLLTYDSNNLVLQAGSNANQLVLKNSNGYVGVGTNNPAYKLDVNGTFNVVGNSTFNGTSSFASDVIGTHASGLSIRSNTSDAADNKYVAISGGGALSVSRGAYFICYGNENSDSGSLRIFAGNTANGAIKFATGSSVERMRIAPDGKIGIGTDTPLTALHVIGDETLSGALIGSHATGFILRTDSADGTDSKYVGMCGGGALASSRGATLICYGNENATAAGDLKLWAGNVATGAIRLHTASNAERLTILNSGNIGIGTASPSYLLHVAGDIYTSAQMYVTGNNIVTGNTITAGLVVGNNSLWNDTTYKAMQIDNEFHILNNTTGDCRLSANAYYSGGWKYHDASYASQIQLQYSDGTIRFLTAPSGTAYAACTLTERMTLDNSGKLGIGITSSLAALLHVKGTSTSNGVAMLEDSADASSSIYGGALHLRHATTATIAIGSGVGLVFEPLSSTGTTYYGCAAIKGIRENATANNQDTSIVFWTRAGASNSCTDSEKMRITSTGSLGINNTTPYGKLEVSIAQTTSATTINQTADYLDKVVISSANSTSNGDKIPLIFNVGGKSDDGISSVIEAGREASGWNSYLAFYTNNQTSGAYGVDAIQEKMRLTSDGNLGIGTAAPSYKLETQAARAAANNIAARFGISGTGQVNDVSRINIVGTNTAAGYTYGVSIGHLLEASASNKASMLFYVSGASAVLEAMRINSDGKVGIGTSAPAAKLDISEGLVGLVIGADNGAITRTDATIKYCRIGSAHYTNAEEPVALIVANSGATNNNVIIGGGSTAFNAATDIKFYTAANNTTVTGTERMIINSSGYVGIGTSSPSTALHVSGDETLSGALIGSHATVFNITTDSADGTDNKVVVLSSAGQAASTRGAYVQVNGNEQAAAPGVATIAAGNGATAGYISLVTSAAEQVRLTANGNVGIGTTNPQSKLQIFSAVGSNYTGGLINGGLRIDSDFTSSNGGYAHNGITFYGDADNASFIYQIHNTNASSELVLGSNNLERMRISAAGNIGIGTNDPNYKLDAQLVRTSSDHTVARFGVYNTGTVGDIAKIIISGYNTLGGNTYGVSIGHLLEASSSNAASMLFYVSGASSLSEKMRINSGGNVGIGTTTLNYKLNVNGDIYTSNNLYIGVNIIASSGSIIGNSIVAGTTSVWSDSNFKIIQIGDLSHLLSTYGELRLSGNAYFSGGWKYSSARYASQIFVNSSDGSISFLTAPSGAAYAACTLTERLKVDVSGNLTFSGTMNSGTVPWARLSNVPSPVITLGGELSGNCTLSSLGNATLSATIVGTETDYSSSVTISGWSSTSIKQINIKKYGKMVVVMFNIFGVSNSIATSFTLLNACQGGANSTFCCAMNWGDNSTAGLVAGKALIEAGNNTVNCYKNWDGSSAWTASGNKGVSGVLVYFTT